AVRSSTGRTAGLTGRTYSATSAFRSPPTSTPASRPRRNRPASRLALTPDRQPQVYDISPARRSPALEYTDLPNLGPAHPHRRSAPVWCGSVCPAGCRQSGWRLATMGSNAHGPGSVRAAAPPRQPVRRFRRFGRFGGRDDGALPARLATYSAWSASRRSSSGVDASAGKTAVPTDTVIDSVLPSTVMGVVAMAKRSRSARRRQQSSRIRGFQAGAGSRVRRPGR
ncbi:MAG: hypothetical protein QOE03_2960, partial [Micromonosporaceae bacterium]|nr:hypothetical protein [Micromonosporaceae bacterium]